MLVIDAHNHLGIRPGARQTGADLVAKIDAAGVDKAVMFPFVEGNFTNDPIKEAYDQFPDRLIPFCAVNPWQPDAAAEVRRCVVEWGFKGLKLHPTLNGFHLSDSNLVDPLFQVAEEFDIPVIVHGASDLYNSPPEFALMAARFPKVSLLMAHMGFFWSVEQAISFARQYPNLYLETSRAPIFEIQTAVRELGPDKVIWGTDSPFVDYEWEFKKMDRATADRDGYAKIVGGNIARLLKL
ncbi:MAG TPA: amidohydrolase family protein [Geminicoccus sp.]|uniref:amidohydrolase family protein n=1 Tax=Geminicoccus sp. TaxID=2024832 RepID=UPI002C51F2DD|nr:amidohydrolase family protein [Geminicoccus sp.]HWL68395.1 amidohydrolase family protein [Geminicoccus sp.]